MFEFIYILVAAGVWIGLEMIKNEKDRVKLLWKIFISLCWPFIIGLLLIGTMDKTDKDEDTQ